MLYYYIMSNPGGQRYDRRGNPVLSTSDDAKLPSVSLASSCAHMTSEKIGKPVEVWRVGGAGEAQVAIYFPRDIGSGKGEA